uniref:ELMO domain-containing protein 3 n=1 Tax=Ciona intestinalis TaxID=7719 RepID=F6Y0Q5_CIOIN|nr:ELMO domain-containing protein 3 [Ciona intestinalis]|eukprot:XP_002132184.1 ELMO domain-containing protein 3 [Ciona intestinalis]
MELSLDKGMDIEPTKTATEILKDKGLLGAGDGAKDAKEEEELRLWQENIADERAEWDALEVMKQPLSGVVKATEDILFSEALQYFQTQNLDTTNICTRVPRNKFSQIIQFMFGPRRLVKSLNHERDLVFCIAKVTLNHNIEVHYRVLQTIYKRLSGCKHNCPKNGSHWESIGFQGDDPATDLRGAGFLALLHLLFLVTDKPDIASEIFRLSVHPEQNFPFCLVSINVTRIALKVLREEKLTRFCNKRKQVVAVMNDFYLAIFWHFYHVWKTQHKTMKDSGHVLKEAEVAASKQPAVMMKRANMAFSKRRPVLPPLHTTNRLSAASSVSDISLQSPAMTSQSLDVVLQPVDRDRSFSRSSDPRFMGIHELDEEKNLSSAKTEVE